MRRRSSRSSRTEIHRYFPEWADRPVKDGVPWESDRNSYSAGGYAEEFGYSAQPGQPAPAKPLRGDPEASRQWRTQTGALHPGYPECSRPLDRDLLRFGSTVLFGTSSYATSTPAGKADTSQSAAFREKPTSAFRVVYVGQHCSDRDRVHFIRQLALLWRTFSFRHPKLHR
jgi:hypothetical protein